MKNKSRKSESNDPLTGELNFEKLEVVAYGPGWKKMPQYSPNAKQRPKEQTKLTRKSTSSKSRRAA